MASDKPTCGCRGCAQAFKEGVTYERERLVEVIFNLDGKTSAEILLEVYGPEARA